MKPSLKLTNAVHILVYIANTKPGERVVSKDIAQSVNTNPSRVRALMSDLFSAGLIEREEDENFGRPMLAKDPEEISMADILEAINEDAKVFPLDTKVSDDCEVAKKINPTLAFYYDQIEEQLLSLMKKMRFSDILDRFYAGENAPSALKEA